MIQFKKSYLKNNFGKFWTWIFDSRPENPVVGVIFRIDFEIAVKKPIRIKQKT